MRIAALSPRSSALMAFLYNNRDFNISLLADDIYADIVGMAAQGEIEEAVADLHVRYSDVIDILRQLRVVELDLWLIRRKCEAEASLGRTGHRVYGDYDVEDPRSGRGFACSRPPRLPRSCSTGWG